MRHQSAEYWTRRAFLDGLTLAGTAGLLGLHSRPIAAEPPPETTRLRLFKAGTICQAPVYVAEELLRSEGFAEVQYVGPSGEMAAALTSGEVDLAMMFGGPLLLRLDVGDPIVILAGGHIGCLELFGTDRIRTIRDLKGKTIAVSQLGSPGHAFIAIMAAHVGLDVRKDIHWAIYPATESMRLFAEGRIDAVMLSPPYGQELRAQGIGHVVVNSALDRPWSQYFCCMVAGGREFVRRHPVATKRALRAILKTADLCALQPEWAARSLVDRGFTKLYDATLQTMTELPYGKWREYDPEDTVRFYALRLHEAGMIKSSPQKLIAQGTDWRFFTELKRELKG